MRQTLRTIVVGSTIVFFASVVSGCLRLPQVKVQTSIPHDKKSVADSPSKPHERWTDNPQLREFYEYLAKSGQLLYGVPYFSPRPIREVDPDTHEPVGRDAKDERPIREGVEEALKVSPGLADVLRKSNEGKVY